MPLELYLTSPTLRKVMDPPDPHAFGPHLPLPPCSLHTQPPCTVESRHPQACACSYSADCMDAKPSRTSCKEELAVYGTTLTLSLARHDHLAPTKEQNDQRGRCWTPGTEYSNATWEEQERTLNEGSSRGSVEDAASGGCSLRKKLRFSKEESALLEERFKQDRTLTPKQKNEMAQRLNLRPRQVEVWFQNRRARTKLKQTELDCEMLRSCCALLTEENRRLQMEVAQLRVLKLEAHSIGLHDSGSSTINGAMPALCPQCEGLSTRLPAPSSSTTTSNSSLGQAPPAMSPPRLTSPAPSTS